MEELFGVDLWRSVDGDNTLALDWKLNEESIVWEIGGYEGRWAHQMWDKFHCNITIFEPQIWAVEKLLKRFENNDKVIIKPFGLWVENKKLSMGNYGTDGASPFSKKEPHEIGLFKSYTDFLDRSGPNVDVCLMNIEGGEFILIPEFILSGVINNFKYFWCQFHPNEQKYDKRAGDIFFDLGRTHEIIWNCYPTAVAWRKMEYDNN
jgi:FkbM family methyltransferase